MMNPNKLMIWRALATVATLVTFPCSGALGQTKSEAKPSKPETLEVKPGKFRIQVDVRGYLAPVTAHAVVLRPKAWPSWKVTEVAGHGKLVHAGEVILRMESEKLARELDQLRRQARTGEIKLELARIEYELGRRRTELERARTRAEAEQTIDEARDYVEVGHNLAKRSAEFSLRSAQYRLEYAQEELNQLRKMYEADDLTEETEEIVLKRAEREVESAAFDLEMYKHSTERRLARDIPRQLEATQRNAELARLSLEELDRTSQLKDEQAEQQMQASVRDHEKLMERIREYEQDLEAMTVRAPFDGVVYYGSLTRGQSSDAVSAAARLRPGSSVAPGTVVMTVVAPRPLELLGDAAESDLFRLKVGQTCQILATAFPYQHLNGHVMSVGAIPVKPGYFETRIAIPSVPDHVPVMPGMEATAKIITYDRDDAITIPSSSAIEQNGSYFVWVDRGTDHAQKQPIRVGQRTKDKLEVLDGLNVGDKILRQPPNK